MTVQSLGRGAADSSPSQQIARRVRGLLGENQISGRRMANAMGMNTSSFHRRYTGETAWTTDELGTLSRLLGVPFAELCAIRDSNPEPADLWHAWWSMALDEAEFATVVDLESYRWLRELRRVS